MEGEEVYLRVKVGGHPPPTLTWYHDGKEVTPDYATELDDDGGVTFPSVEAKHAGVLVCLSIGMLVYVHLFIQFETNCLLAQYLK